MVCHPIPIRYLADWFTTIQDTDGDGILDDTDWAIPTAYTGVNFAKGSVFAGEFLIPFEKAAGQTFKLELTKADNSVLRSWNVNLPTADGQLTEYDLAKWNGATTAFATSKVTDTKNIYNVVRNHLYGIGTRTLDNPTEPGKPDIDDPESLNNKQELTLRVNDNWEVIHSMDLE
jgi:hypothetical protein